MITSASPMAINRSRVETRTSWRSTCVECDGALPGLLAGSELFNGDTRAEGVPLAGEETCVSSGFSILRCLSFITWRERNAPHASSWNRGVVRYFPFRTYALPLSRIRGMRSGVAFISTLLFGGGEFVIQCGQRRDNGGFCAKDQFSEGGFLETGCFCFGELRVSPAAFGTNRQHRGPSRSSTKHLAHRLRCW